MKMVKKWMFFLLSLAPIELSFMTSMEIFMNTGM